MTFNRPPSDYSSRFRLERLLGRGSFGTVHLAYDFKRDGYVAIKTLNTRDAETLYRFKHEFRSLADLRHPNLIRLYELHSDAESWFFTMEFVDGVDFPRYVSPQMVVDADAPTGVAPATEGRLMRGGPADAPARDFVRLRSTLKQLADGLRALHDAGKLHRDVKPSNILVTTAGNVHILDFGLVKELDDAVDRSGQVVGTPVYMSPEQSAGRPLGPASDWYSVGLMLYEILVGRSPFNDLSLFDLLARKREWEPDASDFGPEVPADLADTCLGLLRLDPARRWTRLHLSDIGERALVEERSRESTQRGRSFVGRDFDVQRLRDAYALVGQRQPVVAFVSGSSGMGKTAIVQHWLGELRSQDSTAVLLQARCYEQEAVPYKGLDSLIDALARYLVTLPALDLARVAPREFSTLATLFPVMAEVASRLPPGRVPDIADPFELRRRGAVALRELLTRFTDVRRLVLFIDDLQWGDVDSARLLQEILQGPEPPSLLLVVAYRVEEATTSPCVQALLDFARSPEANRIQILQMPLAALSLDESTTLIRALRRGLSDAETAQIAQTSEGIPFFIQELVQHWEPSLEPLEHRLDLRSVDRLDGFVTERISALTADARLLLELLSIAGRPLQLTVLKEAADVPRQAPILDQLRDEHWIRLRRSAQLDEIELYHARMAAGALARVTPERLKVLHGRLAVALEHSGSADPESLYIHYHAASDLARASRFAFQAAEQAREAVAFNRAADLYARALEDMKQEDPRRWAIQEALGDALTNAGRGEEAGHAYLRAAHQAPPARRLPLHQKALSQFFRTGRFDEGLATLRLVLPALNLKWPETSRAALLALLWCRTKLFIRGTRYKARDPDSSPAADLLRVDACWSISTGLSVVDTLRGTMFQTQGLLWALKAGDLRRICRALILEASFTAIHGYTSRPSVEALFRRGAELANQLKVPELEGNLLVARGVALSLFGEWRAGEALLTQGEKVLIERCSGMTQELDNSRVFSCVCLVYMGELIELRARLPRLLEDASARGDLYAKTMLVFRHTVIHLAADDPDAARHTAADAIEAWSRASFHTPHYSELCRQAEIDLYQGHPAQARARLIKSWPELRRSHFLRTQFAVVELSYLRARASLALAGAGKDRSDSTAAAERDARILERQRAPWSDALAMLVRGTVAAMNGQRAAACALLARAEDNFIKADMRLHAAASKSRRGSLLGGTEGAGLRAEAEAWMRGQGIVRPEGFVSMLAPGSFSDFKATNL